MNAFGSANKGSAQIVKDLQGLFADANFDTGELVAPPQSTLRVLSENIVVVSIHLQLKGQLLVGGAAIPLRDNYSLRILQKQPDGSWLVVSEISMDARQDQSYVRHS